MRRSSIRRRALWAAVLFGGLAVPVPSSGGDRVASWNERIQATVGFLRAGDAMQASAAIVPVLEEMKGSVDPGKGAARAFGLALMLRALAEAQAGAERDALWDWRIAQQLDPALESWKLGEFGAAGALLEKHRLGNDPVPAASRSEDLDRERGRQPTVTRRGRSPKFLEGTHARGWQGIVAIEMLVGVDGIGRYPRIALESHELGIVLDASDVARELVFAPATLDGVAIPVIFGYRVNYKLERR